MCSGKKIIITLASLIVTVSSRGFGGESAVATKVSGGEDHTLVLTESKSVWACGDNSYYQLGIASNHHEWTLIRVHGPDDVGYLQDIDDVDAGWKHSLALDTSDFVWSWGEDFVYLKNRFSRYGIICKSGSGLHPVTNIIYHTFLKGASYERKNSSSHCSDIGVLHVRSLRLSRLGYLQRCYD
jgi:hypothetical protein